MHKMAAIPSIGAAATAVAVGGTSTHATLNLQRPYPLPGMRTERRGRRRLQAAGDECEGDFTVNSLLWADSAGCYADAGNSIYEYTVGDTTYVVGSIPMYNSADSPSVWVAGEVISVTTSSAATLDPHCHSEGDTTVHSHPADVEFWLCDIDNTGTAYTEMTPEQFSTECGCAAAGGVETPGAPTPAAPEAPTPAAPEAPTPAAPEAPTAAAPAALTTPVPAAATRALETPAPLMFRAPTPAAAVTPTTAPVAAEPLTPAPMMAEALTPAPLMAAAPTPAAAVTETFAPAIPAIGGDDEEEDGEPTTTTSFTSGTPNGLCGEIQSLTVVTSSPLLTDLEGCYDETGHEYHEEGGHFFSITGSHLRGQYAIFPGYVDAESTDPRWFVGFVAVSAEETLVYCVSAQPPSAGHPSTANWYCDDGSGSFPLQSESEFNVLCGCDTETSSTTESESETETVGTEPPGGVATHSPVHGATTPPAAGGATEPPAVGATTHPDHGGATEHPAHGATTPPAVGGATEPPSVGATAHPDHGGATEHPAHAHTASPTPTPAVGLPTTAPVAGLEPIIVGSSSPIAAGSVAPVAGHTTSATEHGSHTTSASDHDDSGGGHTTSASDGGHNGGTHSGTPSPTTVARGIIAASATPAPSGAGLSTTVASAASRTTVLSFSGASCLCAVAAGVAGLFAVAV